MQEELIKFSTAKLAKEKGFNIPTIQYYTPEGYSTEGVDYMTERYAKSNWNNGFGSYPTRPEEVECSAPTQYLLQKWLREKHQISIKIDDFYTDSKLRYDFNVCELGSQNDNPQGIFITYEKALEAGLKKALKKINKNDKIKLE